MGGGRGAGTAAEAERMAADRDRAALQEAAAKAMARAAAKAKAAEVAAARAADQKRWGAKMLVHATF